MAETPSPKSNTPDAQTKGSAFAFNYNVLRARIDKIMEYQQQFVGKRNHNPFMWIKNNMKHLIDRLEGINPDGSTGVKETSQALHNDIMNVPAEQVPIVNPNSEKEVVPEQPKTVLTPTGLQLKEPGVQTINK